MPMISGIKKIFSKGKGKANNAILTGVPRSGTTLTCKLLCELPGVIALNEPMEGPAFDNPKGSLANIERHFSRFRNSLLKDGAALAKVRGGKISDNIFSTGDQSDRKKVVKRAVVRFDKALSADFLLVMKHCSQFTLLLPELMHRYPCYGLIRNPLALLASWNSVPIPVSRGRVAKSRQLLPEFYSAIEQRQSLLAKQLFILDWYFRQMDLLPPAHLVKYEDLIASGGAVLECISPEASKLTSHLSNKNFNRLYNAKQVVNSGEQLLAMDSVIWKYYAKEEVEVLLQQYVKNS